MSRSAMTKPPENGGGILGKLPDWYDPKRTPLENQLILQMRGNQHVSEIANEGLKALTNAFRAAHWDVPPSDPYYLSPAYYTLTGRKKLWSYKGDKAGFLFCLHPNRDNHVLIFPPFGSKTREILANFVLTLKNTGMTVDLIRVNESNKKFAGTRKNNSVSFKKIIEEILDTQYPITTIYAKAVAKMEGSQYQSLRRRHKQIENLGVTVESINFSDPRDFGRLVQVGTWWEATNAEKADYSIPKDYFLKLIEDGNRGYLDLSGVLVSHGQEAISAAVWENPATKRYGKTACVFASQARTGTLETPTGKVDLSQAGRHLIVESARLAYEQGTEFLCLGGSETEGMHNFKRSFGSVFEEKSPALETYRAVFGNTPEMS